MVSLLTQIVAGGYIGVPAVDPRVAAHINTPVANQIDEMPAATVEEAVSEVTTNSATVETTGQADPAVDGTSNGV